MERGQADRVLSRLRELLAKNKTLEEAGRAVGYCASNVRKIAIKHQIPRRTRFSPERRRQIRRDIRRARHTLSRLAELYGCHKSTVSRHASALTDQAGGEFQPRKLQQRRVCRTCGYPVKVWPCVACTAQGTCYDQPAAAVAK